MAFHALATDITPPQRFTFPFCYKPHPLCLLAAEEVIKAVKADTTWLTEANKGKMFGVLVVEGHGRRGFLAAYSGLLCGRNDWPFFVPPVYDVLQPDGHFKQGEDAITEINRQVADMENSSEHKACLQRLAFTEHEATLHINSMRRDIAEKKSVLQGDKLIRQSQYLNAELRRTKQRFAKQIGDARQRVNYWEEQLNSLKKQRRQMSDDLQRWLFSQYRMLNARGEERNIYDIFINDEGRVPPSGAGECCAPKLLQYAYANHYKPLCMAEFWWGASPCGEVRHHLEYYPACRGKCKPILRHMLQGLDVDEDPQANDSPCNLNIVYNDRHICVVNKPSGMLSVPGKSGRRSVLSELKLLFPQAEGPMIAHRLDMDTSGLMVVAKTMADYLCLQRQFSEHKINKTYVAELETMPQRPDKGVITLPLRPDTLDRPRQVVDFVNGKHAVTEYKLRTTAEGRVMAELKPLTGRTHQLRIHCSHADGLGSPIVGDRLYGHANYNKTSQKLHLHATSLSFVHPATQETMTFNLPPDWI